MTAAQNPISSPPKFPIYISRQLQEATSYLYHRYQRISDVVGEESDILRTTAIIIPANFKKSPCCWFTLVEKMTVHFNKKCYFKTLLLTAIHSGMDPEALQSFLFCVLMETSWMLKSSQQAPTMPTNTGLRRESPTHLSRMIKF